MAGDAAAPQGQLTNSTTESADSASSSPTTASSGSREYAEEPTADPTEPRSGTDAAEVSDTLAAQEIDDHGDLDQDDHDVTPPKTSASPIRLLVAVGLAVVVVMAGLVGWLGTRAYQSRQADQQRQLFLHVGRQAALNLTTISYTDADADVQRILASATGTFYDDFAKRAQPFIDVVKQVQSKSVGTITEAGLESFQNDQAQVLVAVSVQTSNAGANQQDLRAWRMRIDVQKVGDQAKVSNVGFVP